jgi:Translation elongation factors (GTPases)
MLNIRPVIMHSPLGEPGNIKGLADIYANKAVLIGSDGSMSKGDIPEEFKEELAVLRDVGIENIAESDEVLLEKYLEEGELSEAEINAAIKKRH